MKLNKKLLILVLSLMMLVGIFTVSAFAAEDGVLTIKYQDGTVQTYAEGETIVPPAVPAQFVAYDADGKAYLYTATGTAWKGLPSAVTPDLLGTTVEATVEATKGADQIFWSLQKGSDPVKYFTTNNVHTYIKQANFIGSNISAYITLYADVTADNFSAGSDSGSNVIRLDLNGHSVMVNNTIECKYIDFYIYSSKPGAHFYSKAPDKMIWTNDGGCFRLGDDGTGKYVDNISFHTKVVTTYVYGKGGHIIGGHYYQTESSLAFVDIARRTQSIKNAKFYLAPGSTAVLASDATFAAAGVENGYVANGSAIENCEFYAPDSASILYSTSKPKLVFKNCEFYGVSTSAVGTGTITVDETNGVSDSIAYSTVTFPNGVKEFYVANNIEEAKAYVEESHPYYMIGNAAPYFVEDGGKYYYIEAPNITLEYDSSFNATFTESCARKQVYYTVEKDGAILQFNTDSANYAANFRTYLTSMTNGATVRLWSDISIASCNPVGNRSELTTQAIADKAAYWLDINGYTLTFTSGGYLDIKTNFFYIYSSKEGGVIDASALPSLFRSNNDEFKNAEGTTIKPNGKVFIGEPSDSSTACGKNLTIYCKSVCDKLYGSYGAFVGGTFIQKGSTGVLFNPIQRVQLLRNTTFIAAAGAASVVESAGYTFTNCVFVCESPANIPVVASSYAKGGTFSDCKFVNIVPGFTSATVTYKNCTFGSTDVLYSANLNAAGAAYLAHGTASKTVTANGKTYQINGVIVTDLATVLQITWNDGAVENFAVGAAPYRDYGFVDLENKLIKKNPNYSFSAGVSNGVVTAAGTATATVTSYALEDPFAFTYLDTKTNVIYAAGYNLDCAGTAEGVFEKFYELFNAPASAYVITMYKDMTVNKAMGFGPFVKNADSSHNRDYYNTAVNGNIVWDLNGTTVTVSADTTGYINPAAANFALATPEKWNSGNPKTVFCFEGSSANNSFTLKSSVAGGKIVNESAGALFGVGEGARTPVVFENVTLISEKNYVFFGAELSYDAVSLSAPRLTINGGAYVSGYACIMNISGNAAISNATFVSTNASVSQLLNIDAYRNADVSFDNVVFVAQKPTAPAVYSNSSNTHNASFNDCVYIGCEPTSLTRCSKIKSLTYTGTNIASSEEHLALIYATAPEGKAVAKIAYFNVVDGVAYEAPAYVYAADSELYTVNYGKVTKTYLVGKYFAPEKITLEICDPIVDVEKGIASLPMEWLGVAPAGILDAAFGGQSVVAAFNFDGEIDTFELAFALADIDAKILAYALVSDDVAAKLLAALDARNVAAALYLYADVALDYVTIFENLTVYLNENTFTIDNASISNETIFENGTVNITSMITTPGSLTFKDVNLYLLDEELPAICGGADGSATLINTSVYAAYPGLLLSFDVPTTVFGGKFVNVVLNEMVTVVGGTVLGTEGTFAGCSYADDVVSAIKVNNLEIDGVAYTVAASNVASDFVTVNYVYGDVVRGEDAYLVGSVASFYKEFTTGYYFEYIGTAPLTESVDLECTFHADANKLKAQIVLNEALNYVFYLQVEDDGVLANLFVNGVAFDFEALRQVTFDGVAFYEIAVDFETFADALSDYVLSVDLVSGDDVLTITASAALDEYFAEALASEEDAELVYTVAEYVVALVEYFDYDFAFGDVRMKNFGRINNLLAAYAEYKVELPALPEETNVASEYIAGALLVASEKVTFAFRLADGFDGALEIEGDYLELSNPFEGFDRTYALYEVSLADLDEVIEVLVFNAEGEVVEEFTYSLADYIAGVIAQNEGVAADYAKALWKLAAVAD